MPISHALDHERRLMHTLVSGVIRYTDAVKHLEEEAQERALGYRETVDAREATPELSSADVRKLVALLHEYGRTQPLGATAIVVSTDVAYGTARMIATLLDDLSPTEVFRDMRAAEAWLLSQPETGEGTGG